MANPTAQQCHAMTTYFMNAYREAMGSEPVVNRNKAKMGWAGLLIDFTPTQAKELVDYYLKHYEKPKIDWFLYNYEKIVEEKQEHEKNESRIAQRRKETQKKLEEWRKRWEK